MDTRKHYTCQTTPVCPAIKRRQNTAIILQRASKLVFSLNTRPHLCTWPRIFFPYAKNKHIRMNGELCSAQRFESKPRWKRKQNDCIEQTLGIWHPTRWLKLIYFISFFFPLTITKKMTFSVFPVSTWKEYEENIWNGKTEDIDKLGCCGTLNKILMLYSREIPECCSSQYKKGADFRGRHLLCIAIIIIISSNYFPINLAFYGYCCLLRLF